LIVKFDSKVNAEIDAISLFKSNFKYFPRLFGHTQTNFVNSWLMQKFTLILAAIDNRLLTFSFFFFRA